MVMNNASYQKPDSNNIMPLELGIEIAKIFLIADLSVLLSTHSKFEIV